MSTAFFSGLASSTLVRVMGIVAAAAGLFPMLSGLFVKVVQEGEWGVYMRCGRVRVLKDGQVKLAPPGTHYTVPIWRTVMTVSVKEQPVDIPRQTFHLKDGTQVFLDAAAVYRRKPTGKAMRRSLLGVDNLEQAVKNLCGDSLMNVCGSLLWSDDAIGEHIALAAFDHAEPRARKQCGVILCRFQITGFGKTGDQMRYDASLKIADAITQSAFTVPSFIPSAMEGVGGD